MNRNIILIIAGLFLVLVLCIFLMVTVINLSRFKDKDTEVELLESTDLRLNIHYPKDWNIINLAKDRRTGPLTMRFLENVDEIYEAEAKIEVKRIPYNKKENFFNIEKFYKDQKEECNSKESECMIYDISLERGTIGKKDVIVSKYTLKNSPGKLTEGNSKVNEMSVTETALDFGNYYVRVAYYLPKDRKNVFINEYNYLLEHLEEN